MRLSFQETNDASLVRGIGVRCRVRRGCVVQVEIDPRRPPKVERLLLGKTVESAESLLALVFSVCGHAHHLALRLAVASASGTPVPLDELHRLIFSRDLESVREHVMNLMQPQLQETAAQGLARELLAATRSLADAAKTGAPLQGSLVRTLLENHQAVLQVFFGRFWSLVDSSLDEVLAWAKSTDSPAARLLAELARPGWADFGACSLPALPPLSAEKWQAVQAAAPQDGRTGQLSWDGIPCETSSFTRQARHPLVAEALQRHGGGLLARSLARMVEAVDLAKGLATSGSGAGPNASDTLEAGEGLSQVEAARGRLLHWAVMDQGAIADYRILAPTEWNFNPRGVVHQGLRGASGENFEVLRHKAQTFLNLIDPCVPFQLNFVE